MCREGSDPGIECALDVGRIALPELALGQIAEAIFGAL
jgi:hypothetical protein